MPAFRLGTRTVDLRAGTICEGSVTTELTPTEVRLLHYLSQRPGEVVPREELLAEVWGYSPSVRSRTIDTTASRLRNKIEDVFAGAYPVGDHCEIEAFALLGRQRVHPAPEQFSVAHTFMFSR